MNNVISVFVVVVVTVFLNYDFVSNIFYLWAGQDYNTAFFWQTKLGR